MIHNNTSPFKIIFVVRASLLTLAVLMLVLAEVWQAPGVVVTDGCEVMLQPSVIVYK